MIPILQFELPQSPLPPPLLPDIAAGAAADGAGLRPIAGGERYFLDRVHLVEVGFVRTRPGDRNFGPTDGHFIQGILPWTILFLPGRACGAPRLLQVILAAATPPRPLRVRPSPSRRG